MDRQPLYRSLITSYPPESHVEAGAGQVPAAAWRGMEVATAGLEASSGAPPMGCLVGVTAASSSRRHQRLDDELYLGEFGSG